MQESNSLGVQTCTWTTTTRFGKQRASVRAVQPVKSSFRMHEVILYVGPVNSARSARNFARQIRAANSEYCYYYYSVYYRVFEY